MADFYDVFISYGRADSKIFATYLSQRLIEKGLKVWFDQNDIPPAVDFQNQINDGIEKSHNFIFIIAPHSVKSSYCLKEIELAVKYNKRIIPILHVNSDSLIEIMHPTIKKLNWLFFSEKKSAFDKAFIQLIQSIERESNYVKHHTIILNKALKWLRNYKQSQYLLFNQERSEGESWLKIKFQNQQSPCEPTELHCEYITESLRNANNLMTDVFIGYSPSEQENAKKISHSLRRESITVVLEELRSEKSFPEQSLIKADNCIFFISSNFILSEFGSKAFSQAFFYHKRVFPILTEPNLVNKLDPKIIEIETGILELSDLDNLENYELIFSKLIQKIEDDKYYYKHHKILLTKALKWQEQNYNRSLLLRGYNLQHYQNWINLAKAHPFHPPIDLQIEFIEASNNQPVDSSIEVFISYSRADSDFARKINESLQELGKTTWFDQECIASGNDYVEEIYQGIANSDNFLFIISPHSVNFPYCEREINYAKQLNKRIITILYQKVHPSKLIPEIKKIQWIDFNNAEGNFLANFHELVRTIHTDRDHVHNHTKWLQKAREWELSKKDSDLLLRGTEFSVAQNWLLETEKEEKHPPATALQKEYIQASQSAILAAQEAEKRRQEEIIQLQKERTQEAEARLVEQKKRIKVQNGLLVTAICAFWVVLVLVIDTYNQSQRARRNEIKAIAAYSQALFARNFQLEALTQAIKAGEKLEKIRETDSEVESALKEIVYEITEDNRLVGHQGDILAVQFSPDGKTIATASNDNTVKLWGIDGRPIKTLSEHQGSVNTLAFRPDGQLLASGSVDNNIILWQVDGTYLTTLSGHQNEVTSLAFSPDGQWLVSGSRDQTIKLWKKEDKGTTYREIKSLKADVQVRAVAFSPDGQLIASGHNTGMVNLWKSDGTFLKTIGVHQGKVTKVVFSPNGQLLASSSSDQTIQLWQQESKNPTNYIKGQTLSSDGGVVWDIAFNSTGQYLISGSADQTIKLWVKDEYQWNWALTQNAREAQVKAVAIHPHFTLDSQAIAFASGSADNMVQLWNPNRSKLLKAGIGHGDTVLDVDMSPDGRLIASASLDKTIKLWEIKEILNNTKTLIGHTDSVNGIKISPDGKFIVSGSLDNTVKLWTINGKLLNTLAHDDDVYDVDISPDSQWIVSGSRDKTVRIWGRDGTLKKTLIGHTDSVRTVAISPDGRLIASGSGDNTIKIWFSNGTLLTTLSGHKSPILGVDFSPDSQTLVSGSEDKTIKLWKKDKTSKFIFDKNFENNNESILNVMFSPDGKYIASASHDGITRLWQLDGNLKAIYPGHQNQVYSINFSRNGKSMVSGGADKIVILWDLTDNIDLDQLLKDGCHWLRDYMNYNPPLDPKNLCQKFKKTS